MTRFPCTLCGSRDWPNPDSDCELCQPTDRATDDEPDLRPDRHEDEEYFND